MLWYQGESNTDTRFEANMSTFVAGPTNYACRGAAFVQNLRQEFGYEVPFYYTEVDGCDTYPYWPQADVEWPLLRLSQRAVLWLPHTGFATSMDLGTATGNAHSPRKQEVGRRLALQVLRKELGQVAVVSDGPMPVSAHLVSRNKTHLHVGAQFRNVAGGAAFAGTGNCSSRGSGLCCGESPFEGGGLSGGHFILADAASTAVAVRGDEATVTFMVPLSLDYALQEVTDLRFAWRGFPQCTLYNGKPGPDSHAGVAAAPFRLSPGSGCASRNVSQCLHTGWPGEQRSCFSNGSRQMVIPRGSLRCLTAKFFCRV